jgi:histidyl-tRNA synthetase
MGRPKKNAQLASVQKVVSVNNLEDILTTNGSLWGVIIRKFQHHARVYGFSHVETPLLEDPRLYSSQDFANSLLKTSLNNKEVSVRASLLPAVLRAYYQNKVYETESLTKWSYFGQTIKLDRKNQAVSDQEFGFEVLGSFNHLTEAQCIAGIWQWIDSLGLGEVVLEINSIGKTECQNAYQESLKEFLDNKRYELCDSCSQHLDARVLSVLRCQNVECQTQFAEAPTILDFLDEESHKHFTGILEALDELQIPYQLNPLHASPHGYSHTSLIMKLKTKQRTFIIGEGGYHTDLIASLCGKQYCCFGFSGSMKTIYQIMQELGIEVQQEQKTEVFLVPLGEHASKKSLRLFKDLIAAKITVYDHFGTSGVKNQLKQAELFRSPIALIMGQKEAIDDTVILRDVKSGMQELFSYDKIIEEVKKRLGK